MGRRFGADQSTGIRANAVLRDGETSVEDQERELTVLSFGIDHEGEKLRLAADVGYQDHHIDSPRPSVTPFGGIAALPDADVNFAQPWTFTDEEQFFGVVRAPFAGDLCNPVAVRPPPANFFTGGTLSSPRVTQSTDTSSYAIADTLSFADGKFMLTVGAREQNLETETFDYNTGASLSQYDESKLTPVDGIVYRPTERLSFYANCWFELPRPRHTAHVDAGEGDAVQWTLVPQFRLGLTRGGHVVLNFGVEVPLNDQPYNTRYHLNLLRDFADGSLFKGW